MNKTAPAAKIHLPDFLTNVCSLETYRRWLERKAATHVRRDRKRGNTTAEVRNYKAAIHQAVLRSEGRDAYTGLDLGWNMIPRYRNEDSWQGRRTYRKKFADLPTVDHIAEGLGEADFAICSWRLNDAKNDLTLDEFIEVCQDVLKFARKTRPASARVSGRSTSVESSR